jgi:hypothetical protein
MRRLLALVADACHDFAALYALAVLGPVLLDPPAGWGAIVDDLPLRVSLGILTVSLLVATVRVGQAMTRAIGSFLALLAELVPRRGRIGRWYHLSFREPLIDAGQARESLARICGYRLTSNDYRIVSLRPALRHWRFGVWATVERPSALSRSWSCRYVRWVEDPHELWLLRSAVRTNREAVPAPARTPAPSPPSRLESMSGADMDRLLVPPTAPQSSASHGTSPL